MLDSAFTPKEVLRAWRIWGTPFLHLIAPQLAFKKSCGLSQTCIAVILVWCDNHVPDMRNISKTGQLHPWIGSKTNWPRVNCWCYTLQYFIWPEQERNKMDQSSFHCSWLALGSLLKGCFPSCFRHMCHELTFSVSPTRAGLCSGQQASFEVHLRQVDTKTASYQWRFQFQAHLFDHPDLLRGFQDRAEAHELMQNWQKQHFTGPQLKASLPLEDLCRGYWNVNFGMVEACLPLPAETRNRGAHRIKLRCSERKSSSEIFHVESEAAWNKNPSRAENYHCVPASLVI